MTKISIISSLILSSFAYAGKVEMDLSPVPTSPSVQEAIERAYDYGRGDKDIGGISDIHFYLTEKKETAKSKRFEVLRLLVEKNAGQGRLQDYCREEGLKGVYTDPKSIYNCARYILTHNKKMASFDAFLNVMRKWTDSNSDKEKEFKADLKTIARYVEATVGEDAFEYLVITSGQNVDQNVIILMSRNYDRVIVVEYDHGA